MFLAVVVVLWGDRQQGFFLVLFVVLFVVLFLLPFVVLGVGVQVEQSNSGFKRS